MKNNENSRIFHMFQFCSMLGVFQGNLRQLGGVFGLSRGVLATSWGVLEASWRRLGGILDASWGILGAYWMCLGENVEKRSSATSNFGCILAAKMEATIIKIHVEKPTCFSYTYFLRFFMFLKVSW